MNLKDIGEFNLIARITRQVKPGAGIQVGIGDDAAVTTPAPGSVLLTTTDMLVEGIHFDLSFCDPVTLGRKAISVNLSDIAAMGAKPRHFVVSLALPSYVSVEFVDALMLGMVNRAEEFGVTLIGGDTCSSKAGLVISITLLGEGVPDRIIQRSGATVGDLIFVTGTLGDSALGLEMLRKGERQSPAIQRHLDPFPRVAEGAALAEAKIPTAMIDISDGLLADLGHILASSGVGARVHIEKVPLSQFFIQRCTPLSDHSLSLALAGGEDYELIFTVPPSKTDAVQSLFKSVGTPLTAIGEITGDGKLSVISNDDVEYRPAATGYNHFSY